MKKILIFGLILFLLLAVFGCKKIQPPVVSGQPTTNGGAAGTENQTTTTPTPETKPGIDLSLDKVTWSTTFPEINQPIKLKLTVINSGTEDIMGFEYNVRITKDGTQWKEETKTFSDKLYPGNKTKIDMEYTFTNEGKYSAEVYVDKDNKLGEKNRFNNVKITPEINAMKAAATATGTSGSSESSLSCTDTDDGKDETTKGECDDGVVVFGIPDYCNPSSTAVIEYYCDMNSRCKTESISCDKGCENGACL